MQPPVVHGFFTRNGGVSQGVYASLNCGPGSDDDPAAVAENRRRAVHMLTGRPLPLVTCYQIHSPVCLTVDAPWPDDARPQADALATRTPGLVLGILTADCAPVLLLDPEARVIGAAHAGWKGAVGGVLASTVAAMESLGATRARIRAVVGPCIAQDSYEVGEDFRERFGPQSEAFFRADGNRWRFDLKGFCRAGLERLGLAAVNVLANDTCFEEDSFFSYRRKCLRGEPDYGRQLSAICITE